MKTVDARGQACPKPLILTKKALSEISPGESIQVLIDNLTSRQNVEQFLMDNGMSPSCTEKDGVSTITVRKRPEPLSHPDTASSFSSPAGPHVIVLSSDKMGRGADELGRILMKAFVNTIKEVRPLPSHIVFFNTGILLAADGSALIEPLKDLESMGIKLLVCGTCVEYFKKKDAVRVGTISNMYTILETMTAAGHIVQP
jgi:selenium metabolism protein YedF